MKLRVGDRLLCKRLVDETYSNIRITFTVNKYYDVVHINDYFTYQVIIFHSDNIVGFSFIDKYKFEKKFYLYDYFYTKKELRMEKLNEIEGRR